jgi:lactate racemase
MTPQNLALRYGAEEHMLPLPGHCHILQLREQQAVITPDLFQVRLQGFLSKTPLDLSRPILVVADKTRLCGYPEYLPLLVQELERHGMEADRLRIIVAYGTHARQSDAECRRAYGKIYDRLTFIHHDSLETDSFVEVGVTSRGVPIRHRRDLTQASCIITMGAISHHYFAGYGGGRKLIFPGCGERSAIYANHALYLDRNNGCIAAGCQPGKLEDNHLAADLFEIEETLPASLAIHGILNAYGDVCELLVGRGREVFVAACALHAKACEIRSSQYDLVVASCGGFPKDINFIQSHKAVHNAGMFVRDGGLLLLYAECRDGIGSTTFLPWFELGGFSEALDRLAHHYVGNGGTALAMMAKTARIRIGLISNLDVGICRQIGVEYWKHEQVLTNLAGLGDKVSVACIPNAGLLVRSGESASFDF